MKIGKVRMRNGIAAALILLGSSTAHAQSAAPELRAVSGQFANRIEGTPAVVSSRSFGGPALGGELLPVVNAPFSGVGTTTHVHKLLDGNRVTRKDTTTYYRDGQGRTRVERTVGALGAGIPAFNFMSVNITDPVSGKSLSLQPQTNSYYEFPAGSPTPPLQAPVKGISPQVQTVFFGTFFFGGTSPENSREIPLGERTIDGLRVVGTRVEQTIPAGTIGNKRAIVTTADSWFSEELGAVIESTQRSPTGIETTYRLGQIVRGEPSSDLFSPPADYARQEINNPVPRAAPLNSVPIR